MKEPKFKVGDVIKCGCMTNGGKGCNTSGTILRVDPTTYLYFLIGGGGIDFSLAVLCTPLEELL